MYNSINCYNTTYTKKNITSTLKPFSYFTRPILCKGKPLTWMTDSPNFLTLVESCIRFHAGLLSTVIFVLFTMLWRVAVGHMFSLLHSIPYSTRPQAVYSFCCLCTFRMSLSFLFSFLLLWAMLNIFTCSFVWLTCLRVRLQDAWTFSCS